MREITISNLEELDAFAEELLDRHANGECVGLSGPLGAGKTTFVRSIISTLAKRSGKPPPRVMSPSFVFHQSYREFDITVDHFDFYRLEKANLDTLCDLGYFEALNLSTQNKGFLFVEWPEKANDISVLRLTARLEFDILTEGRRVRGHSIIT